MRLGPGLSFSWRRAVGLTALLSKVSRTTGVPFTKAGRERKLGAIIVKLIGGLFR
jgi:hypothetical protein